MSTCRNCGATLRHTFADLGETPLANAYPPADSDPADDVRFPLHAWVCEGCLLVQLEEFETPEGIFSTYSYFSSWSSSWLDHSKRYASMIAERLGLDAETPVLEIASNDGYLLQYFRDLGIPVLGVEPAGNVAEAAQRRGIDTRVEFFGVPTAQKLVTEQRFALVVANNVLAHVPDLHDFVEGLAIVLGDEGLCTIEVPHLLHLIDRLEFDTIYHEHFSYFSLSVLREVFAAHGLLVVDVDELPTHGGSLRVYVKGSGEASDAVHGVIADEKDAGLDRLETYETFGDRVVEMREQISQGIRELARRGNLIGYGAPAKATTLFNYCGIDADLVAYTVDANPEKQGRRIPGTRISIGAPEQIGQTRPDVIWVLPWNIREEISRSLGYVADWDGSLVVWDGGFKHLI